MNASQPAIVRAALDAALVSGEPRPRVTFGLAGNARIAALLGKDGAWYVAQGNQWWQDLTTEQAVAAIVAARTGRN